MLCSLLFQTDDQSSGIPVAAVTEASTRRGATSIIAVTIWLSLLPLLPLPTPSHLLAGSMLSMWRSHIWKYSEYRQNTYSILPYVRTSYRYLFIYPYLCLYLYLYLYLYLLLYLHSTAEVAHRLFTGMRALPLRREIFQWAGNIIVYKHTHILFVHI